MRTVWALLIAAMTAGAEEKYPSIALAGNALTMTVMSPEAKKGFYRGSRFDWSGILKDVKYNGNTLFQSWKTTHDPANHDDLTGPSEEFRTSLGYADAKEGETFLKIGVGMLVKPKEKDYRFGHNYAIKYPGAWEVESGTNIVSFKQGMLTDSGHGYKYTKTITLSDRESSFQIAHTLANVGTKPIITEWYNHNFYNVNADPIGVNYSLGFPFPVKMKAKDTDNATLMAIAGPTLRLTGPLEKGHIFAELEGYGDSADHHGFTIYHAPTQTVLTVRGSEPLSKLHVWATTTTICPEPYININLKPGETKAWTLEYKFSLGNRARFEK